MVIDIIPAIINPIWATEEYAINAFRSVWRTQMRPVRQAPRREMDRKNGVVGEVRGGKRFDRRIKPYPPSFSKILARIIEPAVGASTWALGSQR